jgi:hypothetical protein
MRLALWATAAMNVVGGLAFVPAITVVRDRLQLPDAPPIYLWVVFEFIAIFGVAYGWCAFTGRAPRLFIVVGAAGKLAFAVTMLLCALAGQIPTAAVQACVGDFVFGILFVWWLLMARTV